MPAVRSITIAAAVALAMTAPAAEAYAQKPKPSAVQYLAVARSYSYTPCAYDETTLTATAYKSGGTEIYYVRIHSYDTCTGANGYVAAEGRATDGRVKIPVSLRKADVEGRVHLNDGSTVAVDEDFTASGPVVVTVINAPNTQGTLRTRTATVEPGTWTNATIYEADLHPVTS